MYTIKFKQMYVSRHNTGWTRTICRNKAHKFATREFAQDFVTDCMQLSLKDSRIQIRRIER